MHLVMVIDLRFSTLLTIADAGGSEFWVNGAEDDGAAELAALDLGDELLDVLQPAAQSTTASAPIVTVIRRGGRIRVTVFQSESSVCATSCYVVEIGPWIGGGGKATGAWSSLPPQYWADGRTIVALP